jgi:protein MpaA
MNSDARPGFAALLEGWRELERTGSVDLREILVGSPLRSLFHVDMRREAPHQVFLSAGVHGDEPVSGWSLLSLARDGLLDPRFGYRIWICMNPTGLDLETRVSIDGLDINRSYVRGGLTPEARVVMRASQDEQYALAIDLHEDFESEGFYLYEPVVAQAAPYGRAILREILEAGFGLQSLDEGFDLGYPSVARGYPLGAAAALRRLELGRVLPDVAAESAYFAEGLPLTMYLLRHGAKRALTFETPCRAAWGDRIAMHRIAVVTALAQLEEVECG